MDRCVNVSDKGRNILHLIFIVLISLSSTALFAQSPKYRTFSQDELSLKKAKAGVPYASLVRFTFQNNTGTILTGLRVRFSAKIISVQDSGGLNNLQYEAKRAVVTAHGSIAPGATVNFAAIFKNKKPGTKINYWWWLRNGIKVLANDVSSSATSDIRVFIQPNGGNVRDLLYKKVITRPAGLMVGVQTDIPDAGWIRYMKSDGKYFPHTGTPRCFDLITTGMGGERPFSGELKNPRAKKHDNHLLGEVHALKLAIVANQRGITEPLAGATALENLYYNDTVNASDPCNGLTIKQIVHRADSALTFCMDYEKAYYLALDSSISRINAAFSGEFSALTFTPLLIAGTHGLDEVYFLHENPNVPPLNRTSDDVGLFELLPPDRFELQQNYPNPFNPTTTIDFSLSDPSIVTLKVYNLLGQEIATLIDHIAMEDGEQSVDFDASRLTSGLYFYKLTALVTGDQPQSYNSMKKMMLVK